MVCVAASSFGDRPHRSLLHTITVGDDTYALIRNRKWVSTNTEPIPLCYTSSGREASIPDFDWSTQHECIACQYRPPKKWNEESSFTHTLTTSATFNTLIINRMVRATPLLLQPFQQKVSLLYFQRIHAPGSDRSRGSNLVYDLHVQSGWTGVAYCRLC